MTMEATTTAIVPVPVNSTALMPIIDIDSMLARYELFKQFVTRAMTDGVDYGTIPGAGDKPTLKKPGAEKLGTLFGLVPRFEFAEKTEDWNAEEPFFYYMVKCKLYRIGTETFAGEGIGSCNSREKKYRWRSAERVCPVCHKPTIIKGKVEYGGGWLCFEKKGGCKAKFNDGDPIIENQQVGQVINPDMEDLPNTLIKMAQKRAMVAAILVATNASEYFTQDIEDLDFGSAPYVPPQQPPQNQPPKPKVDPDGVIIEGEVKEDAPAAPQKPAEAAQKTEPTDTALKIWTELKAQNPTAWPIAMTLINGALRQWGKDFMSEMKLRQGIAKEAGNKPEDANLPDCWLTAVKVAEAFAKS
jgi:hypothetical protein